MRGSDSFSGITANPHWRASDLLAEIGATAILAEIPKSSRRHLLVRRARSRVAERCCR